MAAHAGMMPVCPQSTAPITTTTRTTFFNDSNRKRDGVKFRCERDALVEALNAAGRAVTTRGELPARPSSGLRLELHGDQLQVTGTDLDLTISVRAAVSGDGDGTAVLPAKLLSDIVRSLPPGAVDGRDRRRRGPHRRPVVRSSPCAPSRPTSSRSCPSRPRARSASTPWPSPTRCARSCPAASQRRVPPDPHRRAHGRRGRRPAPGRHRLVPPRGARPPGHRRCWPRASRSWCPPRRSRSSPGCCRRAESVTLRLGERDVAFEVGDVRLTTRLIEGEFPNYRGLIPNAHPNRLSVGREPLLEARAPGAAARPGGHPGAPGA